MLHAELLLGHWKLATCRRTGHRSQGVLLCKLCISILCIQNAGCRCCAIVNNNPTIRSANIPVHQRSRRQCPSDVLRSISAGYSGYFFVHANARRESWLAESNPFAVNVLRIPTQALNVTLEAPAAFRQDAMHPVRSQLHHWDLSCLCTAAI